MNKEKLFKELKELNLLWSGLSRIPNFPKELLELSLCKLENINSLMQDIKELSPLTQAEAALPKTDTSEVEEFAQIQEAPAAEPISQKKEAVPAKSDFKKEAPAAEPILNPAVVDITPTQETPNSPVSRPTAEPVEQLVAPSAKRIPKQQALKPESLVDHYEKNSSKASLQKKLENRHFADLSKALSLNDRFRFRRELFGNSPEKMDQALKEINALQSMDEAIAYLNKNYSEYSESESFTDFCNILENHFTS
ncbi:MAG: hypothetical protein PHT87_00250 [Bacteroidales bacterium]|nr:hypothetical protein [Bacteroidales bacterium]MDD4639973.1 hypothetical protein [Bacteroidales bacterium]